jgi:cytochrome c oxidase assembly protein subunit 15
MREIDKFRRSVLIALFATLILVAVGGIVRATGAGLGCPDWPHCFGSWIPPTSADQLPPEFDKSRFNVVQTWTEYINRLIGVTVGFLILFAAFRGIKVVRLNRPAAVAAWLALLLVAFQGWLGGVVVQSELTPWLVTAHMLTAIAILMALTYAWFATAPESARSDEERRPLLFQVGSALYVVLVSQIAVGTQVREHIDEITNRTPDLPRSEWLAGVNPIFVFHATFAWAVLLLALILFEVVRRSSIQGMGRVCGIGCPLLLVAQMLIGGALSSFAIPPVLQVLHLAIASTVATGLFLFLLITGVPAPRVAHAVAQTETQREEVRP